MIPQQLSIFVAGTRVINIYLSEFLRIPGEDRFHTLVENCTISRKAPIPHPMSPKHLDLHCMATGDTLLLLFF